jgi:hypothetical protein
VQIVFDLLMVQDIQTLVSMTMPVSTLILSPVIRMA